MGCRVRLRVFGTKDLRSRKLGFSDLGIWGCLRTRGVRRTVGEAMRAENCPYTLKHDWNPTHARPEVMQSLNDLIIPLPMMHRQVEKPEQEMDTGLM